MLISVMGFAGSVYAAAKSTKGAAHHAAKHEVLKGEIAAVDAIGNKLIVKDDKAVETTFNVDATAKITSGGKAAKLADLKIGDKVTVTYKNSGADKIAISIK